MDSKQSYDSTTIVLHWLSAIIIFGLFALGWWMVELDYYSSWYHSAPHWHKSIGALLGLLTMFRILWRMLIQSPSPIASHSNLVRRGAKLMHWALYGVLILISGCGYLISTADGSAIEVFNWFNLASMGELFDHQEDISGAIHKYSAYTLMALVLLHALAAIKHHVVDKDATLIRMIKLRNKK